MSKGEELNDFQAYLYKTLVLRQLSKNFIYIL